jgi:hypothetical protein
MRPSTVEGWETTSESVNPRKPVVGASEARRRTWLPRPNAAVEKALAAVGSGTSRVTCPMDAKADVLSVRCDLFAVEPGAA